MPRHRRLASRTRPTGAGPTGIPNRLLEHLALSGGRDRWRRPSIGLPIGLYIGHTGRGANLAINLANIGRAVPSYALIVMILPCPVARAAIGYAALGLTFCRSSWR